MRLLRLEDDGSATTLDSSTTQFTIHFERGCGAVKKDPCPMGRTAGWIRNVRFDWVKMWGECMGITPNEAGLPPPKGPGSWKQWYEAKWRTRGGCK